jgi:DNA processing protein
MMFRLNEAEAVHAMARLDRDVTDPDGAVEDYSRAIWSCLIEPGDGVAGTAIAATSAAAALREVLSPRVSVTFARAAGIDEPTWRAALARWRPRAAMDVGRVPRHAEHAGARLLVPGDPAWPTALDDLGPHRPVCLWWRGALASAATPSVATASAATPAVATPAVATRAPALAIVGARAASAYGEHVAFEIAGELAARGVTVVSGAAYGIDGGAHRAALAVEGTTVAFLAGGVDRLYPAGHAELLERIIAHGAVLSEAPCGTSPTKWRFLQRNRLIAAFSHGTVVVEAGQRSGSLNTASHAATLGRPLGAVPGPVTSATSAGCHTLLRQPDVHLIRSAEDALEMIGFAPVEDSSPASSEPQSTEWTGTRTRVRDALSSRAWRTADDLARLSGMARSDVLTHLGMMTLDGEAEHSAGRWRRIAP